MNCGGVRGVRRVDCVYVLRGILRGLSDLVGEGLLPGFPAVGFALPGLAGGGRISCCFWQGLLSVAAQTANIGYCYIAEIKKCILHCVCPAFAYICTMYEYRMQFGI